MKNTRLTRTEIIWISMMAGWTVLNLFLLKYGGTASRWESFWNSNFTAKVKRSPHEMFYPFETKYLAFYDLYEFLAYVLTPLSVLVVFFLLSRFGYRKNSDLIAHNK